VRDAGGAVEHRHRSVLVVERLVDVGAGVEQQPHDAADAGRARRGRLEERRVARMRERLAAAEVLRDQPGVGGQRLCHRRVIPQHERDVEPRARQPRIVREQALGDVGAAVQGGAHEPRAPLLAVAARGLHVVDERGPGREAEVLRHGTLRVGEPRLAVGAQAAKRLGVTRAGGAQQFLRAAARLVKIELHHDSSDGAGARIPCARVDPERWCLLR
jgi:hypothetical protein